MRGRLLGRLLGPACALGLLCLATVPHAHAFCSLHCAPGAVGPHAQVCGLPRGRIALSSSVSRSSRCSLPAPLRMRDGARETGVAARWNEKGFGFVEPDNGGEVLFCHAREIVDGSRYLAPGSIVEFTRQYDRARGKEEAAKVTILRSTPDVRRERGRTDMQQGRRGRPESFRAGEERGGREGPRESGVALRWNEKGFGFIQPDSGGDDLFCHLSQILDGDRLPIGGMVEFVRGWDRRGKEEAKQVTGGIPGGPRFKYQRGGGLEELSDLMAKFYAIHKPEKVEEVMELANDFLGREEEYNGILYAKYGADLTSVQPPPETRSARLNRERKERGAKYYEKIEGESPKQEKGAIYYEKIERNEDD